MPKILLVDDERALVKGLKLSFEREGYTIVTAHTGTEALQRVSDEQPDLVVLDIMLPELDGLEVCKRIRQSSTIPIIMLTARSEDIDKILGLEMGADDYLTKPFNTRELLARVKAHLRRLEWNSPEQQQCTEFGALVIDHLKRRVTVDGKEADLTAKEFDILATLAANPGRVYTRENLLESIWGYKYFGDVRNVDVHVRRLREKIEPNPAEPEYVMTRWGMGYYFREH
ncbi:MAG TPA: response regulator transcription factor [Bacillota bacterium]|nr:response regulator transcription factor [Bacillota bacterium]